MSKIKLVLTDIDGTLVPVGGMTPSIRVKRAIEGVQKQGIEVAAATGRPYGMVKDLFQHVGFHDLSIFDAGASIRRVETGEVVWEKWLTIEKLKEIVSILLPVSSTIDFFPDQKEVDPKTVFVERDIVEDAPYVFALVREEESEIVLKKLQAMTDVSVHVHYAHDDWKGFVNVQITHVAANKYHAVLALRDLVQSTERETLAIGDSANDLPLLSAAGVKIAMGNAIDELKAMADFVVSDVDHDGFAEAMERFVLTD